MCSSLPACFSGKTYFSLAPRLWGGRRCSQSFFLFLNWWHCSAAPIPPSMEPVLCRAKPTFDVSGTVECFRSLPRKMLLHIFLVRCIGSKWWSFSKWSGQESFQPLAIRSAVFNLSPSLREPPLTFSSLCPKLPKLWTFCRITCCMLHISELK